MLSSHPEFSGEAARGLKCAAHLPRHIKPSGLRSTETEASNRHVSELIDDIKKQHVKAIFLENTLNPKVTTQITRETGAKIGGSLYPDGLGTGAASTYEGMMKHNVSTIVDALKSG